MVENNSSGTGEDKVRSMPSWLSVNATVNWFISLTKLIWINLVLIAIVLKWVGEEDFAATSWLVAVVESLYVAMGVAFFRSRAFHLATMILLIAFLSFHLLNDSETCRCFGNAPMDQATLMNLELFSLAVLSLAFLSRFQQQKFAFFAVSFPIAPIGSLAVSATIFFVVLNGHSLNVSNFKTPFELTQRLVEQNSEKGYQAGEWYFFYYSAGCKKCQRLIADTDRPQEKRVVFVDLDVAEESSNSSRQIRRQVYRLDQKIVMMGELPQLTKVTDGRVSTEKVSLLFSDEKMDTPETDEVVVIDVDESEDKS